MIVQNCTNQDWTLKLLFHIAVSCRRRFRHFNSFPDHHYWLANNLRYVTVNPFTLGHALHILAFYNDHEKTGCQHVIVRNIIFDFTISSFWSHRLWSNNFGFDTLQKMLLLVKCHFTENLAKLRLLIISGLVHILERSSRWWGAWRAPKVGIFAPVLLLWCIS